MRIQFDVELERRYIFSDWTICFLCITLHTSNENVIEFIIAQHMRYETKLIIFHESASMKTTNKYVLYKLYYEGWLTFVLVHLYRKYQQKDDHACYPNSIMFQRKDAKQTSFSDHSYHIMKKDLSCIQSAYYLMCKIH